MTADFLPRSDKRPDSLPFRSSGLLILVVDDDPGIRRLICSFLRNATMAGILETSDPSAASSTASNGRRLIDLLISDIRLSADITGIDLAHKLTVQNPAMKVLLISATGRPRFQKPSEWRFLEKPFALSDVLDCVSTLCSPVSGSNLLELHREASPIDE